MMRTPSRTTFVLAGYIALAYYYLQSAYANRPETIFIGIGAFAAGFAVLFLWERHTRTRETH